MYHDPKILNHGPFRECRLKASSIINVILLLRSGTVSSKEAVPVPVYQGGKRSNLLLLASPHLPPGVKASDVE